MDILEKLGLSWMSVLFHVLNLLILIAALYYLLYKPVRKMIGRSSAETRLGIRGEPPAERRSGRNEA